MVEEMDLAEHWKHSMRKRGAVHEYGCPVLYCDDIEKGRALLDKNDAPVVVVVALSAERARWLWKNGSESGEEEGRQRDLDAWLTANPPKGKG